MGLIAGYSWKATEVTRPEKAILRGENASAGPRNPITGKGHIPRKLRRIPEPWPNLLPHRDIEEVVRPVCLKRRLRKVHGRGVPSAVRIRIDRDLTHLRGGRSATMGNRRSKRRLPRPTSAASAQKRNRTYDKMIDDLEGRARFAHFRRRGCEKAASMLAKAGFDTWERACLRRLTEARKNLGGFPTDRPRGK